MRMERQLILVAGRFEDSNSASFVKGALRFGLQDGVRGRRLWVFVPVIFLENWRECLRNLLPIVLLALRYKRYCDHIGNSLRKRF